MDVLIPIVQPEAVAVKKKKKNYILYFEHTVGLGHSRNFLNSLTTKCCILLPVFKTATGFVCDRPVIRFPRPVQLYTTDYIQGDVQAPVDLCIKDAAQFFNPLVLELGIKIVAHHLCKM